MATSEGDLLRTVVEQDGGFRVQLEDAAGRRYADIHVRPIEPETEGWRLVWSNKDTGAFRLEVEWFSLLEMIGPWWRARRWLRREVVGLWRMLRR